MATLEQFLGDIGAGALPTTIEWSAHVDDKAGGPAGKVHQRIQDEIAETDDRTLALLKDRWDDFSEQIKIGDELVAKLKQEDVELASLESEVDGSDAFLPPLLSHLETQQSLAAAHLWTSTSVTLLSALLSFHSTVSTLSDATSAGKLSEAVQSLRDVARAVEVGADEWIEQTDVWKSLIRWSEDEQARLETALQTAVDSCFSVETLSEENGELAKLTLRDRTTAVPDGPTLASTALLRGLEDVAVISGRKNQSDAILIRLAKQLLRHFVAPFLEANGGPAAENSGKGRLEFVLSDEGADQGVHTASLRSATSDGPGALDGLSAFLAFVVRGSSLFPTSPEETPSKHAAVLTAHLTPSLQSHVISSQLTPTLPASVEGLDSYMEVLAEAIRFEAEFLPSHHLFAFLPAYLRRQGHEVEEQRVIRSWANRVPHHWARHVSDSTLARVRSSVKAWDWGAGEIVEVQVKEDEEMLGLLLGLGLVDPDDEAAVSAAAAGDWGKLDALRHDDEDHEAGPSFDGKRRLPRELALQTIPKSAKRQMTIEEALRPKIRRPRSPSPPPPPVTSQPAPSEPVSETPAAQRDSPPVERTEQSVPSAPESDSPATAPVLPASHSPADSKTEPEFFTAETSRAVEASVVSEAPAPPSIEPPTPPASVQRPPPPVRDIEPIRPQELSQDEIILPPPAENEAYSPFEAPASTAAGIETTADTAAEEDVVRPHEYRAEVHENVGAEEEGAGEPSSLTEDNLDGQARDEQDSPAVVVSEAAAASEAEASASTREGEATGSEVHPDQEASVSSVVLHEMPGPDDTFLRSDAPEAPHIVEGEGLFKEDGSSSIGGEDAFTGAIDRSWQHVDAKPAGPYEAPHSHQHQDIASDEAISRPEDEDQSFAPAPNFAQPPIDDGRYPNDHFAMEQVGDEPASTEHDSYNAQVDNPPQAPATAEPDTEFPIASSESEQHAAADAAFIGAYVPIDDDPYADDSFGDEQYPVPTHDDFFSPPPSADLAAATATPYASEESGVYEAPADHTVEDSVAHQPSAGPAEAAYLPQSYAEDYPAPPSGVHNAPPPPPRASGSVASGPRSKPPKRRIVGLDAYGPHSVDTSSSRAAEAVSAYGNPNVGPDHRSSTRPEDPYLPSGPIERVKTVDSGSSKATNESPRPVIAPLRSAFTTLSRPARAGTPPVHEGPILNHIQQRFVSPPPTTMNPYVSMSLSAAAAPPSASSYLPANDPLLSDLLSGGGSASNSSRAPPQYFSAERYQAPAGVDASYSGNHGYTGNSGQPPAQPQNYYQPHQSAANYGYAPQQSAYAYPGFAHHAPAPQMQSAMRMCGGASATCQAEDASARPVMRLRGGADLGAMDDEGSHSADDWGFDDDVADSMPDGEDDGWGFGDEAEQPDEQPEVYPRPQPQQTPLQPPSQSSARNVSSGRAPADSRPAQQPSVSSEPPDARPLAATSRPASFAYSPTVAVPPRDSNDDRAPLNGEEDAGDDGWGFGEDDEAEDEPAHNPISPPSRSRSDAQQDLDRPHLDLPEPADPDGALGAADDWGFGSDADPSLAEVEPTSPDTARETSQGLTIPPREHRNQAIAEPAAPTPDLEMLSAGDHALSSYPPEDRDEARASFGQAPEPSVSVSGGADAGEDEWDLDPVEEVSPDGTNESPRHEQFGVHESDHEDPRTSQPVPEEPSEQVIPASEEVYTSRKKDGIASPRRVSASSAERPPELDPAMEDSEASDRHPGTESDRLPEESSTTSEAEASALVAPASTLHEAFPQDPTPAPSATPPAPQPLPHSDLVEAGEFVPKPAENLIDYAAVEFDDANLFKAEVDQDREPLEVEAPSTSEGLTTVDRFPGDEHAAELFEEDVPVDDALLDPSASGAALSESAQYPAAPTDDPALDDFADIDATEGTQQKQQVAWEPFEEPSGPPQSTPASAEGYDRRAEFERSGFSAEPSEEPEILTRTSDDIARTSADASVPTGPEDSPATSDHSSGVIVPSSMGEMSSPEIVDAPIDDGAAEGAGHSSGTDPEPLVEAPAAVQVPQPPSTEEEEGGQEGAEVLGTEETTFATSQGPDESTVQHEAIRPAPSDESAVQHEWLRPIVTDSESSTGDILAAESAHPQQRVFTVPASAVPDGDAEAEWDFNDPDAGAEVLSEPAFEHERAAAPEPGDSEVQHVEERPVVEDATASPPAPAIDSLPATDAHPQQRTFTMPASALPEGDPEAEWDFDAPNAGAEVLSEPAFEHERAAAPQPGESKVQHVEDRPLVEEATVSPSLLADEPLPAKDAHPQERTFTMPASAVPEEDSEAEWDFDAPDAGAEVLFDPMFENEQGAAPEPSDSEVQHVAERPVVEDATISSSSPGDESLPAKDAHPQERTLTMPASAVPEGDVEAEWDSDAPATGDEVLSDPTFGDEQGTAAEPSVSEIQHVEDRSVAEDATISPFDQVPPPTEKPEERSLAVGDPPQLATHDENAALEPPALSEERTNSFSRSSTHAASELDRQIPEAASEASSRDAAQAGQATAPAATATEGNRDNEAWGDWDADEPDAPANAPVAKSSSAPANRPEEVAKEESGVRQQQPDKRERMMVSRQSREILRMAEDALSTAFEVTSPDFRLPQFSTAHEPLLRTFVSILSLYRATASIHNSNLLASVPAIAMQFANDAEWIGREADRLWSAVPRDKRASVSPEQTREIEVAIHSMRQLGRDTRQKQISIQQSALMESLDEAGGFLRTADPTRYSACERALQQVMHTLQRLALVWKPIMTPTALYTTLGGLANEILLRVLDEIEDQTDISEEESIRLNKLSKMLHELEGLFDGSDTNVGREVPIWYKFSFLSELLEASMADFMFLFDNRFLLDFTPQELVRLLRALFADSPQRDAAVKRVLQGHPEATSDAEEES